MDEACNQDYTIHTLDGLRTNPAKAFKGNAAGAPGRMTAHLIEQGLSKEKDQIPERFRSVLGEKNAQLKMDNAPKMTIEMIPKKKIVHKDKLYHSKRNVIQHTGEEASAPLRTARRTGYNKNITAEHFTVNECAELGYSSKFPVAPTTVKTIRTIHGEDSYQICGAEDMRKAATNGCVKSDVLPSARLLDHNNRTELFPFERKDPAEIVQRPNRLLESTGMWGCLNYSDRRKWEPPEEKLDIPPGTPGWVLNLRHEPDPTLEVHDSRRHSVSSDYKNALGVTSPYRQDPATPSDSEARPATRPEQMSPNDSEVYFATVDAGPADISAVKRKLQRSASAPTSRASTRTGDSRSGSRGGSRGGGGSRRLSRASSASSVSYRTGTPARRASSKGSESPMRPAWRG
jgi:hypothetical protein